MNLVIDLFNVFWFLYFKYNLSGEFELNIECDVIFYFLGCERKCVWGCVWVVCVFVWGCECMYLGLNDGSKYEFVISV